MKEKSAIYNFVSNISVSLAAGQTAVGSLAQIIVFLPGVLERGGGEWSEVANTNRHTAARQSQF